VGWGFNSSAQKVERAIREGEDSVPALLGEFASLMKTQVNAIEQALRNTAAAQPEEASTAPFSEDAAVAAIGRLRTLLEASDGDAQEALRSLHTAVAGTVEKPQLDALSASINDFDFEAALLKLDEIAECCARNGEQAK
jgi:two-component system, sensor histidine kinase and response regulator